MQIAKNGDIMKLTTSGYVKMALSGVRVRTNKIIHDELHRRVILGNSLYDQNTPARAVNSDILELTFMII